MKTKASKSSILFFISSLGVVTTAYLAARATPKVKKKIEELEEPTKIDIIKTATVGYLPAIACGASTILCMYGVIKEKNKIISSINSAYLISDQMARRYRQEFIDKNGVEADQELRLDIVNKDTNLKGDRLLHIFEPYSQEIIDISEKDLRIAEANINKLYVRDGFITLHDLLEELHIKSEPWSSKLGVSVDSGLLWIIFNIKNTFKLNGETIHELSYPIPFDEDFSDFWSKIVGYPINEWDGFYV